MKKKITHKKYAKMCGMLSKKFNIPFKVCLSIGTSECLYDELLLRLYFLGKQNEDEKNKIKNLLFSDQISDQKKGLLTAFGVDLYQKLGLVKKEIAFESEVTPV